MKKVLTFITFLLAFFVYIGYAAERNDFVSAATTNAAEIRTMIDFNRDGVVDRTMVQNRTTNVVSEQPTTHADQQYFNEQTRADR